MGRMRMGNRLVLATRRSPLALAQAKRAAAHLRERLGAECELLQLVTTGDRQAEWSLEEKGGKGLFTRELEAALLRRDADVAVHSAKDLPGESAAGLSTAGYLPREIPPPRGPGGHARPARGRWRAPDDRDRQPPAAAPGRDAFSRPQVLPETGGRGHHAP